MSWARALVRATRLVAVTCCLYPPLVVGHLILRAPRARARWRRRILRRWSRAVCAALAVRAEVVGTPPPAGSFLVCNHLSYLDIVVIGSQTGAVFVSKAEVADWPVVGRLAKSGGTIFVERQRKRQLTVVNRSIRAALEQGDSVVVFPEGTSTKGDDVLHFRPSLLAPAAEGLDPVYAASLSYSTRSGDPPASLAVCWWGDMGFTPHVLALLKLRGIQARLCFAPSSTVDPDRKALSEKLRHTVKAHFRPVT